MNAVAGRLGALAERNFRLVFTSSTISSLGDGVSTVALVFAVLHISHDSPTAVGLVIAARQVAAAAITLAAGVWADRLPRHLVLVVVAAIQAVVQTISGVSIVTGHTSVALLAVLAVVYGLADGFVMPASQGLIPAVVSASRLQQANALLGLSRSLLGFIGPAVGGLLVTLGSPGSAILVDAASFAVAALLLIRLAVPPRADAVVPERFLDELRAGWGEFRRQTWIWTTIVFFGIGNFAGASLFVLGPLVMKEHYSGASSWAAILSLNGVGAIVGGLIALRWQPNHKLVASVVCAIPYGFQTLAIGLGLPFPLLLANSAFAGLSLALHLTFWFTVFQERVPEEARSRVNSYDALGSFVLIPVGSAIAGPIAGAIGARTTLTLSGVISLVCIAIVLAQPSVRRIDRLEPAVAT